MSGFDRYVIEKMLISKGWTINAEGAYDPPDSLLDEIAEGYFTLDEAADLQELIRPEGLNDKRPCEGASSDPA